MTQTNDTYFNNLWKIDAEELIGNESHYVILDCRFSLAGPEKGKNSYLEQHIEGAFFVDLEQDLSAPVQANEFGCFEGGKHPLPNLNELREHLRQIGINDQTKVVLYDQSLPMFAARAWWMLRLLGNDHCRILNGGINAYTAAGGTTTAQQTARTQPASSWQSVVRNHWIIDRNHIIDGHFPLVDARAADRFAGNNETLHPMAGHIPGALNAPFTEHFVEGMLSENGPNWPKNAIHQCGSGVTACVNLWVDALKGRQELPLYVGSWSDWCAYLATTR